MSQTHTHVAGPTAAKSTTRQPLVSVIIPTYNRRALVVKSIMSVLEQTYRPLEIIVVDDASTDGTEDILKTLPIGQLRYIKLPVNSGGGTARNMGLNLATGSFVAFLDSDDVWSPTKIEDQVNYIVKIADNNSTVVYSQIDLLKNTERGSKLPKRSIFTDETVCDYLFCWEGMISTCTMMLSTELAKRVRFTEKLRRHQDHDFALRLQLAGASFYMLTQPLTSVSNDRRPDRVSSLRDYRPSYAWGLSVRQHMSQRAYNRFMARIVAPSAFYSNPLLSLRQYSRAVSGGHLSPTEALVVASRLIVPYTIYQSLRDWLFDLLGGSQDY